MRTMSEDEARWVRENAWNKTMRRTYKDYPRVVAGCGDYGACASCLSGQHDECQYEGITNKYQREWADRRADEVCGYVCNRHEGVLANLWEVGVRHDHRCECYRNGHHGLAEARAHAREVAAAAIAATDGKEAQQGDLLELLANA